MPPTSDDISTHSTAVEMALLRGRVEQVIVDHERRIAALETQAKNSGTRAAALAAPWIAGCGLLLVIVFRVPWA